MAQIQPSYPIVTYPQAVLEAFCFDEPFPMDTQAPRLESYPEKPQDPTPLNVKEPRDVKGDVSFANWAGLVCLFVSFFAFSFTKDKENPLAITFGLLFVGLALRIWYGSFKTSEGYDAAYRDYSRVKAEHDLFTKHYQKALGRYLDPKTYAAIDQVNFDRLATYAQTESFRQYCARVEKHERLQLSLEGLLLLMTRNTRCQMIHAYTRQHALSPSMHGLPVSRGAFDEYFYHLLKKEFPEKVFLDYSVIDPELGFCRYFPDIVYADFGNKMFVDIEIDEPYTTNKQGEVVPIHYSYEGLDGRLVHVDEDRNNWFNANGWAVVRFSEAQVAEDPDGCVGLLRKLITSFETGLMCNEQASPLRQSCWTDQQALEMSQAQTRSDYFSVRVVAPVKRRREILVGSSAYEDGRPRKDNAGRPLGFVRVEQFIKKGNSSLVHKRRVAFLTGTQEEFNRIIANYKLRHGSVVPGKIVVIESLQPQWKGHQPKIGTEGLPAGFMINNNFYPVYASYQYKEDVKAEDVVLTEKEARAWTSAVYPDVVDDLPF